MWGWATASAVAMLGVLSGAGLLLATRAIGTVQRRSDLIEFDLIVSLGITMSFWSATAAALFIDPSLGSRLAPEPVPYSIARGAVLLAIGQAAGWCAFLYRRWLFRNGKHPIQANGGIPPRKEPS